MVIDIACGDTQPAPMKHINLLKLTLIVLPLCVCGSVQAWFFNSLHPYVSSSGTTCSTCNYDDSIGVLILGPNNCLGTGIPNSAAYSFISEATGPATQIRVAVTLDISLCTGTTNQFKVTLYDDARGGPNNVLFSAIATAPPAPCAGVTVNIGTGGPVLTLGRTYWVACEPVNCTSDFVGVWWAAFSGVDFSQSCPVSYTPNQTGAPGAFRVN